MCGGQTGQYVPDPEVDRWLGKACKSLPEACGICAPTQGYAGQPHPGGPSIGAGVHGAGLRHVEVHGRLAEHVGLVG